MLVGVKSENIDQSVGHGTPHWFSYYNHHIIDVGSISHPSTS